MEGMHDTKGYVRIERSLTNHPIWHHKDPSYLFLFMLLITRAIYSGPKRGTLTVSAQALTDLMPEHFKMTRDRIRGMLLNLERWDMVETLTENRTSGTNIKITNYGKYQCDPLKIEADKLKAMIKNAKLTQEKSPEPADVPKEHHGNQESTPQRFTQPESFSRNVSRKDDEPDSFDIDGFNQFTE